MNLLLDQFQAFLATTLNCFKDFDFNDFFRYCKRYLMNALDKSIAKRIPLEIILRMIGTLPILDFDRSNEDTNDFAHRIMTNVRRDFIILYQSVDKNEQPLFKIGLIILLCIELLYSKRPDSSENEVGFLQEIDDKNERQDIAYKLLCRLQESNFPIVGDSSWTEILTIVNPANIDIKYLNLANSLESFLRCISNICRVLSDSSHFQEQMNDYFEERISKDHIQGK